MKKIAVISIAFSILSAPPASAQVITSINGQTNPTQVLNTPGPNAQNSMHMEIIQQGNNTNRFRWDGSPWRIDQGGTGALSLPSGILVGNGTSTIIAATVLSPLTFSSNQFGCQMATSTQDGCLSAADWTRFDAAASGSGSGPSGNNKEIQFNDNGVFGANSKFIFDSATGFFGVGTTTPYRPTHRWEFLSETADPVGSNSGTRFVHTNYNSGGASPLATFTVRTARGTQAAPQPLIANDTIGALVFSGFDGTAFPEGTGATASIAAVASENFGSTAHGSTFLFENTTPGTNVRTTKMRLTGSGNLAIGAISPTERLSVSGNILATGNGLFSGNVGVGTITPTTNLEVFSSETTTLLLDNDSETEGSCLIMKDSDGSGYTYITANDGILTASTTPCN